MIHVEKQRRKAARKIRQETFRHRAKLLFERERHVLKMVLFVPQYAQEVLDARRVVRAEFAKVVQEGAVKATTPVSAND